MKLEKINHSSLSLFSIKKLGVTSGASRRSTLIKSYLPLRAKHKKLLLRFKWSAGRTKSGRLVVFSKGSKSVKIKLPFVNYSFRDNSISLISGFFLVPFKNRVLSLIFSASGGCSYIPTPESHEIFRFTKLHSMHNNYKYVKLNDFFDVLYPQSVVTTSCFLIYRLSKNVPVCLLEILPLSGIQYTRSAGSKSIILKMDTRINSSLVKLSSGVSKIFSIYSIASKGNVCLKINRKSSNNSAGYQYINGRKPCVRGVAMNPVDHPHGGRAKSIKYPLTPWGKTTKFK